jgi:hypothetical protein
LHLFTLFPGGILKQTRIRCVVRKEMPALLHPALVLEALLFMPR